MTRTDYYDDPNAPRATTIVPAVTAVVVDAHQPGRRILLQHRVDNDRWALPGGVVDPGESMTEAAVRETREETGIEITVTGLVGVYSDPKHVIAYDDGEVRQQFSVCVRGEPVGGQLSVQESENKEVAWVPIDELDDLNIHPAQRLRMNHGIAWQPGLPAYIG